MTDWMVGQGHMVRFHPDSESAEQFDEFSLLVPSRTWTWDEGSAAYALVPLAEAMELRRDRGPDVCGVEWRITGNVSTVCGQSPGHSSAHCGPVMWRTDGRYTLVKEDN